VPGSSAFVIPLTGGEMIQLDCNTVIWAFGIKLTFLNLCDQQTSIHSVGRDGLPAALPAGYSLVLGLDLDILTNGQLLASLPEGTGIELDFPTRSPGNLAVMHWDEELSQWVEVTTPLSRDRIPEALETVSASELYKLTQDPSSGIFPVLTTDKIGVFILVRK
jgi:hypothetical protein